MFRRRPAPLRERPLDRCPCAAVEARGACGGRCAADDGADAPEAWEQLCLYDGCRAARQMLAR